MAKKNKQLILDTLQHKAQLKQKVYDVTLEVYQELKEVLNEKVDSVNKDLKSTDDRVSMDYMERSKFQTEIKVAGDLLLFSMHSNVFEFDRSHGIWKISYVEKNKDVSFCGIINIYNFLADSFKYKRMNDLGYLIGRIFINKDRHFFVEGKRQLGFLYNNFGQEKLTKEKLTEILDSAILYSLDFDLLVPPYENVAITNVAQMQEKFEQSRVKTGKRLGFKFYSENDTIE
jgi:hypothetical protein